MFDHNVLPRLPTWVSRWFGYRPTPPAPNPDYVIWIWSFVGAFGGTALIQAVFEQAQYFIRRQVPGIVASFGASAVLVYGTSEAPLAQPRALFAGHFLGAFIGVVITKLFQGLPTEERFNELAWLAASLSCATTIVAMQMTRTTHPPGGATAIIPALTKEVRDLGWYYIPVILLSAVLTFAVALITNNVQRRYPTFWFTPPAPAPDKPSLVQTMVEAPPSRAARKSTIIHITTPSPDARRRSNSFSAEQKKPDLDPISDAV